MELPTRNRWVGGRFVGLERPLACPLFGAVAGATVGVMHSQRANRKSCMIEQIASNRRDGFPKEPLALSSLVHGIPSGKGARMKEDEIRFVRELVRGVFGIGAVMCVG